MKSKKIKKIDNSFFNLLIYNDTDKEELPNFTYTNKNILNILNPPHLELKTEESIKCNCRDGCGSILCPCVEFNRENNIYYNPPFLIEYLKNGEIGKKVINGGLKKIGNVIFECTKNCNCNKKECRNKIINDENSSSLPESSFLVNRYKKRTKDGDICSMWGLMTLERITKFSYIFEYCGEIINKKTADSLGTMYDKINMNYLYDLNDYVTYINKNQLKVVDTVLSLKNEINKKIIEENYPFCIDAYNYGNLSRFMNHSCDPNVFAVNIHSDNRNILSPRIHFFANRSIDEGEELTFNYNCAPLKNKNKKKCACESHCCNGFYI